MTTRASWPIHVLVFIAAVGATGCPLERASDTPDPDDLWACESSGRCGAAATTSLEQSLTDLPRNGLSPLAIRREALTAPGTQELLQAIMSGGLLSQTTLSTSNREWLGASADARALMKYVASCALAPGDSMDPQVSVTGEGHVVWPGALGLCRTTAGGVFGNWADAPPTPACLEIVSSCVLARVNALQKKVVISMRGESNALTPLLPQVPVVKEYRENGGTPIASFTPTCAPGQAGLGALRDCAWEGRFVGSCMPDQTVKLQTTAPAMMRVCKGIHGCNQSSTNPPWYSEIISSVDASTGTMIFTCPRNGVSLTARSYFAVMLASPTPGTPLAASVDAAIGSSSGPGPAKYPCSEAEVFTYREGAFFGNIFDPRYAPGDPYHNILAGYQYACHSELWDNGAAHDNDRLCADPNYSCFANVPGQCTAPCTPPTGAPQPLYTDCSTTTPTPLPWTYPITVYLNHPCDLARDIASCQRAFPSAFTTPLVP